jgi:hypothetical protein
VLQEPILFKLIEPLHSISWAGAEGAPARLSPPFQKAMHWGVAYNKGKEYFGNPKIKTKIQFQGGLCH